MWNNLNDIIAILMIAITSLCSGRGIHCSKPLKLYIVCLSPGGTRVQRVQYGGSQCGRLFRHHNGCHHRHPCAQPLLLFMKRTVERRTATSCYHWTPCAKTLHQSNEFVSTSRLLSYFMNISVCSEDFI